MDLSKLPKLSNTPEQQQNPPLPVESQSFAPPAIEYKLPTTPGAPAIAGDVWFNAVIGLILIALGFTFARFLGAKLSGQPFHTGVNWTQGPNDGSEVAYFDLEHFAAWTDMGVFLFGLVLLLEAASKAAITIRPGAFSKALLTFAMVLTLIATSLNLYVCIKLFSDGITPILSGLAVAFGGWILTDEWRTLKAF